MSKSNKQFNNLLPYWEIEKATTGDVDAVNRVLSHYSNYIYALSKRQLCDGFGNIVTAVDEEMRCRLETKLITKILLFNVM